MKQIPMLDLRREYEYMKDDIDMAIGTCLDHQRWIFGPEVKEFEDTVSHFMDVKHCVGVSSGTDALVLSLRALAIKVKGEDYWDKNDLIITTPFTFTATGDAILRAGATPLFVDIDPNTYNIDAAEIEKCMSSSTGARIVGIIPVHLYGMACDMDEIMRIAKERSLFVVEDVAQAFGGSWKGQKLGSIGTTGIFSFFPSKNLGGFGDGGMIATPDDEISTIARMLVKHGGKDKYNVDHIGYNARLDTLQASVLLAKMKYIDEFNERRRRIAGNYSTALSGMDGLVLPVDGTESKHDDDPQAERLNGHVYHQYTISTSRREALQSHLKVNGISTMIYYPFPLHKMKVFKARMETSGALAHAERAAEQVLSLPMEPLQSVEDIAYVVDSVKQFFKA